MRNTRVDPKITCKGPTANSKKTHAAVSCAIEPDFKYGASAVNRGAYAAFAHMVIRIGRP